MVVRVESADHSWVWLYMVLQLEAGEHPIRSNNFIIRYVNGGYKVLPHPNNTMFCFEA